MVGILLKEFFAFRMHNLTFVCTEISITSSPIMLFLSVRNAPFLAWNYSQADQYTSLVWSRVQKRLLCSYSWIESSSGEMYSPLKKKKDLKKKIEWGCLWWLSGKESACHCRRWGFDPWSGKIPCATEPESSPHPLQLEKALAQQPRHSATKNQLITFRDLGVNK